MDNNARSLKLDRFLRIIYKYWDQINEGKVSKEKLFRYFSPKRSFDAPAFNRLNSLLVQLFESYIIRMNLENDEFERTMVLSRYYLQNNLGKEFSKQISELERVQESTSPRDYEYYFREFLIQEQKALFSFRHADRTEFLDLELVSDKFDQYYLLKKLMHLSGLISRQKIANVKYNLHLSSEIINFLESENELMNDSVRIWCAAVKLQLTPNKYEFYMDLKELLAYNSVRFHKTDLRSLYVVLENSAKAIFIEPIQSWYKELFELYQKQIEQGVLYNEFEQISADALKNIVTVAGRLRKFTWADDFLETHRERIYPQIHNHEVLCYNLAFVEFQKANYENVLELLRGVTQHDMFYKLSSKRLLLKTAYELEEWDLLSSSLNAYGVFLHRLKSINEKQKKVQQKFATYLKKITRIATDPNRRGEVKKVLKELLRDGRLPEKIWLEEKLEELL